MDRGPHRNTDILASLELYLGNLDFHLLCLLRQRWRVRSGLFPGSRRVDMCLELDSWRVVSALGASW